MIYKIQYVAIIIIILLTFYILIKNTEDFEVTIGDPKIVGMRRQVDLTDFFQFVEYFQLDDLDQKDQEYEASWQRSDEKRVLRNDIVTLLQSLYYIVYVNNKDNFYHRYLISYTGSTLQYDGGHPLRRINYDEMVENKISNQYTMMSQNEYDNYYPRPNLDSRHQSPVVHTLTVHNYYKEQDIMINLLVIHDLLEKVQQNDTNLFSKIVRPTEQDVFENEFIAPLITIKNCILNIVDTDMYKEYLSNQKFQIKYERLAFNPLSPVNLK